MSIKYLLLKLTEEAGEVVVAAIKHRIRRTDATRVALEKELGDLFAICKLLDQRGELSPAVIYKQQQERYDRERKRDAKQ